MATSLNAKVIIARCSQNRACFGMRVEQRGKDWVQTWAFPMNEGKAAREGYSATSTVTLTGESDPNFPGCPHCQSDFVVRCECGKIGCGGSVKERRGIFCNSLRYTCPWCGKELNLDFVDGFDVSGGTF